LASHKTLKALVAALALVVAGMVSLSSRTVPIGAASPAKSGVVTVVSSNNSSIGSNSSSAAPQVNAASSWTVYHGDPLGTGADTSGVTFNPPTPAWQSPVLDGQLYGEPLEATGRVFVATENDTIYALAADSGAVLWSTNLGSPVQASQLPCGDISPTVGITGTPVVDVSRGEIFAVADVLSAGAPAHVLVGLDIYSGTVLMSQPVDPPGQSTDAILQRTGLNLSDGNVVFGYGGNSGDCSSYSGWVVSVPEGGGAPGYYQTVPIGNDGAVWMGGAAPEVDAAGNIWVATGNGTSSSTYDNSDSVIELSPALALKQLFAPTTWQSDNQNDLDLGSTAPALLSNGTALQVGKSSIAYFLNQGSLGGISSPPQIPACGSEADGGDAIAGTVVYVPCGGGVQAIQTSPLGAQWQTNSGANGPPITSGGLVWSIGGSHLYGLNPANGQTVEQVSVGAEANHFPTPSVGDGLLLAPSTNQVYAFSGSAGLAGPPSPVVLRPASGATLSGSTSLDASAPNATAAQFVLFGGTYGFSGLVLCNASLTSYGWFCSWNTTSVPNGSYVLTSEAFNSTKSTYSSGVSITINNPLPTPNVLIPSKGATLSGSTYLDASASNAASVKFLLFGGSYGFAAPVICTATPTLYGWLCAWNTTTVPNGSYVVVSEAFNSAGSAFSSGIGITVKN
jgi:hypothetical protein